VQVPLPLVIVTVLPLMEHAPDAATVTVPPEVSEQDTVKWLP
jgi:hypothetical protein